MRGTVNDDDVKHVLMYILHNNQRFDPDVRLDAVDLLRTRNNDPDVRSALCQAVHTDHNAAVRLKALEALNGAEPQDIIRQTLLDALVDDQNPGVRVEAINALRDMAAKGQVDADDHLLAVSARTHGKRSQHLHPAAERSSDSRSRSAAKILNMIKRSYSSANSAEDRGTVWCACRNFRGGDWLRFSCGHVADARC